MAVVTGLTVEELVSTNPKIRRLESMRLILEKSAKDGIVEQRADGAWQLTPWASAEFGVALAELEMAA